jgi:uncharacterized protein (TIGR02996 family)
VSYIDGMATTNDGAALLHTILEQPGEDAARLVYSDWLEEQGQTELTAQAEFIRCQVRLALHGKAKANEANWPHPDWLIFSKREALRRRERELLTDARWLEWAQPIPELTSYAVYGADGEWDWTFRRGFVDEVSYALDDWMRDGPTIVAAQPVISLRTPGHRPNHVDIEYFSSTEQDPNYRWNWWLTQSWDNGLPDAARSSHWLPLEFLNFLTGRKKRNDLEEWAVTYRSGEDAGTDLTTAAVNWARSAAGLPPLT